MRTPIGSPRLAVWLTLGMVSLAGARVGNQAPAAEWPQWGGPGRDFKVEAGPIRRRWSDTEPREIWRRPLGEGYSSIVAAAGRLVTMYRAADEEVIISLDAATGETRWEHRYPAPLAQNGYFDVWLNAAGPGPYSTPLLTEGAVYALGVDGQLHALDLATGAPRWSHDLVARFDLTEYNAFASSPLAFRDTVVLPLGGSGQGVVALDQETGAVVWQSDPFNLAPGSPVLVTVDREPQLVVWGQQALVGLDPGSGRQLWTHAHENDLGLNLSTPVWGDDGRLFVSSAYNGGSRVIQLRRVQGQTIPEEIWSTPRMRLHFGNALRLGDLIIGSSGDFGPAFLTAVEVDTGAEVWRDRRFARAHLLYADDCLVIVDETGEVAVATVTEDGLVVHGSRPVLTENAWTPPTLVGTTLYLRDRRDVVALDLSE